MPSSINRRNFLKVAGAAPLSVAFAPYLRVFQPSQPASDTRPNILIVVFDAFSAYHLPFYGYPRNTAPNIARLAERAIVYHNHYAGGNFTTPGTASLLTGVLPWTHRAFKVNSKVTPAMADRSIFKAFPHHYRVAYSHNPLVNTLFDQFSKSLDSYVSQGTLMLTGDTLLGTLTKRDEDTATVAWVRAMQKRDYGTSYSLFLSEFYQRYIDGRLASMEQSFPRGLPTVSSGSYFRLEDAIDWLKGEVHKLPVPYLGYFHFMPPHAPSASPREFVGRFDGDGFVTPNKPVDVFSKKGLSPNNLLNQRMAYDEYILYLDREFGRLFDGLASTGALENTWVVLTADHGELFERGYRGHGSAMMYQALVRIPLVIFPPGNTKRMDITVPTSAVDVLPTLLHLSGEDPAGWTEGSLLPPFASGSPEPNRPVYCLNAVQSKPDQPLQSATVMLLKGRYKLTYFFGYDELGPGVERIELYDVEADPEELHDLYPTSSQLGSALLRELKAKLDEVNRPYASA